MKLDIKGKGKISPKAINSFVQENDKTELIEERNRNLEVENRYSKLSDNTKMKLIEKDKKSVKQNITISTTLLLVVLMIGIIILTAIDSFILVACILGVVFVIGVVSIVLYKISDKKKTDEQRIKRQLKIEIEIETKNKMDPNYVDYTSIVKVTLVDSYTEVSDKLHAVLNYQEIIQTRYYKFKVDFKDGTSKIVTAQENSENYNKLMSLIGTEKPQDRTEELRKYKELLDAGVITEEEFEAKKKQILGL